MSAKPVFLIPGGHPSDIGRTAEDFRTALQASGAERPKIAYVGTANGDNRVFFQFMKRPMMKAGAASVTLVPIVGKSTAAAIGKAKKLLYEADAVFLSGGEVEDGIVWLRKAGLDVLLTELYHGGKLFFGSSAGCIMMGRHWVHWDVEDDDSTSSLFDCLNFVPMVFDTHCENEGWKELKCALRLLGPGSVGHGLSTGGFYSADEAGNFATYRNPPAMFYNNEGKITDQPN